MYTQHNIVAILHNHCRGGYATTYIVFISTSSYKQHNLQNKIIEDKIGILIFCIIFI